MESSIQDTLIYVKVGLGLFLLTSIYVAIAFGTMLLTTYGPQPRGAVRTHITPMEIRSSLFAATVPLVLAVLVYVKIARPLKEGKIPSKPWNLALTILGYGFALIIGGVLLSIAYYKTYS